MTTVTLEVPDELALKLLSLRDQVPHLLAQALESKPRKMDVPSAEVENGKPIYMEIVDFLATNPMKDQIAAFKISSNAHGRLEELLEKNSEEGLTVEEAREVDTYLELSDVMMLLKANAT